MRAQTHFNNHILVTLWSIIPRLFCYHRFHSPYVFCVHVNLSARGSSNLYVCRREGGGVNVDVDGRHKRSELLRTFEPPSFVMTKKITGQSPLVKTIVDTWHRKTVWGACDCSESRKAASRAKGRKGNCFPGCAFWLVCIGFPKAGIPLQWSEPNKWFLLIFNLALHTWFRNVMVQTTFVIT